MERRWTCGLRTLYSTGPPSLIRDFLWASTILCWIRNRRTFMPLPTATPWYSGSRLRTAGRQVNLWRCLSGSQRILIANKLNAPLDNNTSLVLKGDVLCTANLGFVHAKPEEADRTVVCMKGFPLPK